MSPDGRPATVLSPEQAQVTLRSLRPLVGYLRGTGRNALGLLQDVGIDPLALLDSRARIPYPVMLEAWRRAEAMFQVPALGLAVIDHIEMRPLDRLQHESEWIIAQLFVISSTVHEGLTRLARYFPVGFYGSQILVTQRAGKVLIRHDVPFGCELPRAFSEFVAGLLARLLREFPARPVALREVRFSHAATAPTELHERVFGTTIRFLGSEDALLIDEADLDIPLRAPNASLAASLMRIGDEILASLAPVESFVDRVRALLVAELPSGNPNAEHIAEAMHLSIRTLSRRLREHGTSHKALLDEIRASLARRYLLTERRPVSEVAVLLGFSEPSAFHRAFKRWYGESPTFFREKALSREG